MKIVGAGLKEVCNRVAELAVGVLASGRGSNFQAIAEACRRGEVDAAVRVLLSDQPDAPALAIAGELGIPAHSVLPRDYSDQEAYERALVQQLQHYGVELVCLAGYMRLVTRVILEAFPDRVINIHPSLLPAFPGLHAQRQAWEYGVKYSGCTVHFVDAGVDTGPIIAQIPVPVRPHDTAESLADHILVEEHKLYPQVIRWFAQGRVKKEGRRVQIEPLRKE